MIHIYLVRHGQAGSRAAYDALSAAGRRQAELLGRYLASQELRFEAAWTGTLRRQRDTARAVREAYLASGGGAFPGPLPHSGWDEFDLDAVYNSLAPILREEDGEFRREHDALLQEIEDARHEHAASIHRRWTSCDVKIVKAWVSGKYGCAAETWQEFHDRVAGCRHWRDAPSEANLIVFTSATPIGVWCALAMDVFDGRAMRLAGALYNSSLTVLQSQGADVRLHTFNSVPHLAEPKLRTYR